MALRKKSSDRRNSADEVARITRERLELLEAIRDMDRLEVRKQLTDNPVSGKPPNTGNVDSIPQKKGKQEV
jgi:hypothetical protein